MRTKEEAPTSLYRCRERRRERERERKRKRKREVEGKGNFGREIEEKWEGA